MRKIFLILALLITGITYSQADQSNQNDEQSKSLSDNPTSIKKYVVDETGTLTSSQTTSLISKLVNFEKASSNQLIVYIIPSLNGEPIENVSVEIARKNKIGKKDKNNGVLLLVAMKDKKMRIEVGYGLEGALTDALSSQIIENDLKPAFRKGQYYEGINKATDNIILATKGEYKGDGTISGKKVLGSTAFVIIVFVFIFIFIVISIIRRIFGFGRGMITGRRGSRFGGFGSGFMAGSLFSGGSDWGSGSSGSSGGDSGGFSGGGGDFGGGGASGGW